MANTELLGCKDTTLSTVFHRGVFTSRPRALHHLRALGCTSLPAFAQGEYGECTFPPSALWGSAVGSDGVFIVAVWLYKRCILYFLCPSEGVRGKCSRSLLKNPISTRLTFIIYYYTTPALVHSSAPNPKVFSSKTHTHTQCKPFLIFYTAGLGVGEYSSPRTDPLSHSLAICGTSCPPVLHQHCC